MQLSSTLSAKLVNNKDTPPCRNGPLATAVRQAVHVLSKQAAVYIVQLERLAQGGGTLSPAHRQQEALINLDLDHVGAALELEKRDTLWQAADDNVKRTWSSVRERLRGIFPASDVEASGPQQGAAL